MSLLGFVLFSPFFFVFHPPFLFEIATGLQTLGWGFPFFIFHTYLFTWEILMDCVIFFTVVPSYKPQVSHDATCTYPMESSHQVRFPSFLSLLFSMSCGLIAGFWVGFFLFWFFSPLFLFVKWNWIMDVFYYYITLVMASVKKCFFFQVWMFLLDHFLIANLNNNCYWN